MTEMDILFLFLLLLPLISLSWTLDGERDLFCLLTYLVMDLYDDSLGWMAGMRA